MKRVLAVLTFFALGMSSIAESHAHGPYYGGAWGIRFGIGYGYHYPHRYYYPSGYFGINVWPRRVAPSAPAPAKMGQGGVRKLYVYPAAGQSDERMADDRYECHVWAAGQSGHDPTLSTGSRDDADAYARAFTACMEARRYVVR
jgi:hypothetical protein